MSGFNYEKDANGVVTVTMDMEGPVNSMSEAFLPALRDTVEKLEAETDLTGVVLASAKKTFFAGGDLNSLCQVTEENAETFFNEAQAIKAEFRRLEKLGKPTVAAINGAALGGGLELALACHYRIAWDNKAVQLGFPEVTLGLLPGGGGVVKSIYLMGLMASNEYLIEGKRVAPAKAKEAGLINETVDSLDDQVTAVEITVLCGRSDQIQHLLCLLFGHAAALHALLKQALCVGFALLCRLLRDIFEDHLDARHGRHIGNALPHHARAQYAHLLSGLGLNIFGARGTAVNLIQIEEKRVDHVLRHRRERQFGQAAALDPHSGIKIHAHGRHRHIQNLHRSR